MKMSIFEFMEKSVDYIEQKSFFIDYVAKQCKFYFKSTFQENPNILNINSRIKSTDSIKEKILKQNYIMKCEDEKDCLTLFPDIVGIRIECRFIEDEKTIYKLLQKTFCVECSRGYFKAYDNNNIFLKIGEKQPQIQRNGFEIYKIDGLYLDDSGNNLNFEIQIKSMVNVFWGEIDHTILYKNFNYIITEDLVRDIMYSIKNNLTIIDMQLSTVYNKLMNIEANNHEETKKYLKNIITKMIHDVYILKMKYNLGIVIDIRGLSDFVTDFTFSKIDMMDSGSYEKEFAKIFGRIKSIINQKIYLENFYDFEKVEFEDLLCHRFAKKLSARINQDFNWNLAISIIQEIEKNEMEYEFRNIVAYVITYIRKIVENETRKLQLPNVDRTGLADQLSEIIVDYLSQEFYIGHFTQASMSKLSAAVERFLKAQAISKKTREIRYRELWYELDYLYRGVVRETENE